MFCSRMEGQDPNVAADSTLANIDDNDNQVKLATPESLQVDSTLHTVPPHLKNRLHRFKYSLAMPEVSKINKLINNVDTQINMKITVHVIDKTHITRLDIVY